MAEVLEKWFHWKDVVWSTVKLPEMETGAMLGCAVAGIAVWVVTTPIRNVGWALGASALDCGTTICFFWYTCSDRFVTTVRGANAKALPPREYACILVTLLFLVPMAVLRNYESRFEIFGRLCLRWCEA